MPILANKIDCTGCAACMNSCARSAIQMVADEEGFLVPIVDKDKCVECKLCEKSCPVITKTSNTNTSQPKAYAVWNNIDRRVSSSGGAFSSFARYVLKKGGAVFGAAFDSNLHCHHIKVTTIEGLDALRGSKYVQSEIGNTYKEVKNVLKNDKYVLFCGTPCQVAGLKAYLRKDYEKLITLDLACHGVPSDSVFQAYKSKISTRFAGFGNLYGFEFRRRDGWGFAPSISLDGKFRPIYDVDALFMCAFDKSALFRKCCYHCSYANSHRVGDCSLADFWGLGRYGVPFKHNVMKGVSLVLANNTKGEDLLKHLDDTFIEERTLKEALIENHNLKSPSELNPQRDEIIKAFLDERKTLDDIDKQFNLVDHSLKGRVKKYALQWGLFDLVKRVYNFYKAH